MTSTDLACTDPPSGPTLGDSRARVLTVLQAAGAPLGVGQIAEMVGLHPNTTRFHLDALVVQGLAERVSEERDVPGRPRSLYSATGRAGDPGPRSYRMLAEILVDYLARNSDRPAAAAVAAGESWGRALAEHSGDGPVDAAGATAELLRRLSDLGFAPEVVRTEDEQQVVQHHCPFREVADLHPDVVCGIHLGIMRGVLDELGAPLHAVQLDPLVAPNRCVTHLSAQG